MRYRTTIYGPELSKRRSKSFSRVVFERKTLLRHFCAMVYSAIVNRLLLVKGPHSAIVVILNLSLSNFPGRGREVIIEFL